MSTRAQTPVRAKTPTTEPQIAQPDHFFPPTNPQPTNGLLDPDQDANASRGIPVFKPSMDEFQDFESYMKLIEPWGMKSGIVKVIPPEEWRDSLPDIRNELPKVKISSPIEQNMVGNGGKFVQENIVRRKEMTVREWVNLCNKDDFKAPATHQVGVSSRGSYVPEITSKRRARSSRPRDTPAVVVKDEESEDTPSRTASTPVPSKRKTTAAEKSKLEADFAESFNPHTDWLPTHTTPEDYSPEFCNQLERHFWRNLGLGKPAWYGADSQGSLFDPSVTSWNVATLQSTLTRLLPSSSQGLPGVNTPYLYFGMWRATFAWHVEDMDLFSINYIHFGAPKFWYAMPQAKAASLEHTMRGFFPSEPSRCSQFLRHKSFLVSPRILAQSSCGKPNTCVQQAGEFVITYPFGYHAGFNLGLNCAESVNFALDSWIPIGRKAKVCECVPDSVRIDVDQLLTDRAIERGELLPVDEEEQGTEEDYEVIPAVVPSPSKRHHQSALKLRENGMDLDAVIGAKRKASGESASLLGAKKARLSSKPKPAASSLKIKLPACEEIELPCCLCVSLSREGLLPVFDPPTGRKDVADTEQNLPWSGNNSTWMAHEECAKIIPETWVDEVDDPRVGYYGVPASELPKVKMVFGVDGIVKNRWALKCVLCTKSRQKSHGAPIQCTKGKCPKAFHVNCAKDASQPAVTHEDGTTSGGGDVVFEIAQVSEKEIILVDNSSAPIHSTSSHEEIEQDTNRVLKSIHKYEVNLLCAQHNPIVASRKKASKQNRIRDSLLSLPPYSRIKIRISSGVFEVTLVRVIVETSSVEVLWDQHGTKREFKWNSVVRGDCRSIEVKMGLANLAGPAPTLPPPTLNNQPYWNQHGHAHYPMGTYYSAADSTEAGSSQHYTPGSFYAPGGVLQLAPLSQAGPSSCGATATSYHHDSYQNVASGEQNQSSSAGLSPFERQEQSQVGPPYAEHSPAQLTLDHSSPASSSTPQTPSPEFSLRQDSAVIPSLDTLKNRGVVEKAPSIREGNGMEEELNTQAQDP